MATRIGMEGKRIVAVFAAILCSAALGYENLHNDEVQLALLGLLLSTFILGFVRPKGAWCWAIIIAIGIPLSGILALRIGNAYPCRPGHPYSCTAPTLGAALSSVFVLIPAFLSAYAGAWLRWMTTRSHPVVEPVA